MPSPVPARTLDRGDHSCAFYTGAREHADMIGPFVGAGLTRGEKILYFSDVHVDGLLSHLQSAGVDVSDATRRGRIEVSTAYEAYTPDGRMRPDRMLDRLHAAESQARTEGYAGLRIAGDVAGEVMNTPEWLDYERRVNAFFARGYSLAVCLYRRDLVHDWTVAHTLGAHPLVIAEERVRPDDIFHAEALTSRHGLRLAGELDHATVPLLAEALEPLLSRGENVVLDCGNLTFIDAAGGRIILRAARILGERTLVLESAPSVVVRVLSLLGKRPNIDVR